jgi:hypothetical protein
MSVFRRFGYPFRLAAGRLAHRGERVALVGIGIAAGAALLAAVLAGSLVAQDRSLRRALGQVAPGDRTVRIVWGGIDGGGPNDPAMLNRVAQREIAPLVGTPTRAMLFRETESNGHLFDLGAIDGLGRYVHLRSGRLPTQCRPARCEVVQFGGSGPIPRIAGLNLVRVGRATLTSKLPLGTLITRETYANVLSSALLYHTAATPPLLLAEGVQGLAENEALSPTYRSYAWTAALSPQAVHPWTVDRFTSSVERTRSALEGQSLAFDISAPTDELAAANASGRVAARRLLVIGGDGAALLLAFAVLTAIGLRRDAEAEWRRLTWYGARRWQLVLVSSAEAIAMALAGAVAGWAIGTGIGAIVAERAGVSSGAILAHSVLSGRGFALVAAIAVAAAFVVLLSLRGGSTQLGVLTITPVDAAALGAIVTVAVALARGAANASTLSSGGTGVVLLLLPALIAFAAGVIVARSLTPALRLLERLGRRGSSSVRLAALSLARNPGRAAVAVAFVVVSLGLALFAESYRATLERGQRDQAAFAAPADFLVREDLTRLVPVLGAAPLDTFRPLGTAMPVLRKSVNVHGLQTSQGVTLVGVPAAALRRLRWRSDNASLSPSRLAQALAPHGSVALEGVRLPARARTLAVHLQARGDPLTVRAVIVTRVGDARGVELGLTTARRLRATIPSAARGGLLVGFEFAFTNTGLHGVPNGGQNAAVVARGTIRIGGLRAGRQRLSLPLPRWTGAGGVTLTGDHRLRYVITGEAEAQLRARQPTDGRPVPVVVTPALASAAGPGGILPLSINDAPVVGQIVAVARRIPTVDGDAVLADEATMATALDAASPGTGLVDEVWLNTHDLTGTAAALRRAPFDTLSVTSHAEILDRLRSEPLARGTLLTLAGAAVAALALALLGLQLGVVADLRDERGELFDLESQGADPRTLRAHLRLRAALIATVGVLGGIATGAILTSLIVSLVTLTAAGALPEPPLVLSFDWSLVVLGFVAYLVVGGLAVAVATQRAFRANAPGRLAEVGT